MSDGYFDDAPHQAPINYNQDGSINDPLGEAAAKSADNLPFWKQGKAAWEYWGKVEPSVDRLFEGEATIDDYFTILDESLNMAVNFVEACELGVTIGGSFVGGPGELVGAAVSTLVSVGLTFILEYFQPVQDMFGMITGNPDRIRVSRDMWTALSEGLATIGEELMAHSQSLGEAWQDAGSDAARARLVEGNDVVTVAAALATGMSEALEFCAATFEKVQGFCINRASDVADALVSYVPRAVTGGPPEWAIIAVEVALMAARIVLELLQIAMYLGRAMGALCALMNGAETAANNMVPYIDKMSAA